MTRVIPGRESTGLSNGTAIADPPRSWKNLFESPLVGLETQQKMNFPKTKILESTRCRLRYISKDDIPHIFKAAQYPGFTDGMLWDPPETEDELIAPYENNVKAWAEDLAYTFAIETKQSFEFLGRISIRKKEEEGLWDLGFWTHPEQQGKGFMSEAVRAVIEFGFRELEAGRIIACHAIWNKRSERVLKKNGMSLIENIPNGFQKNGKWIKENMLGITRIEWEESQR
jgi:ribosomal-protein-alanine N-acetyltransferase